MAHRMKHRDAALKRRIMHGRTIKSDLTPQGRERYFRVAEELNVAVPAAFGVPASLVGK